MKRFMTVFGISALLLAAGNADAQVPGKTGPATLTLKPAVPSAFKSRMSETVTLKDGTKMTAQQVVDGFIPGDKITVAGGKQITVQELMDRVGRAESAIIVQGGSLRSLKKKSWALPTTQAKAATQRAAVSSEVSSLMASAKTRSAFAPSSTPPGCSAGTCWPSDKNNSVTFDKKLGDEDMAAAYTNLTIKSVTPDSFTTSCQATWDNGVYILKKQQSLLKFTADVKSTNKAPAGWSASAALYALGQATPVWSKNGKVSIDALDRTFATPKVVLKQVIVPGISVEGDLKATATLTFTPNVDGTAPTNGVQCTLGLTPKLVGTVDGGARVVVGISDLIELAEGGVRGNVDVLTAKVPSNLTINLTQQPLALNLRFKSDLDTTFMKGRVYAYYKIADICALGKCLLEDGLGIPTYGELDIWEDKDGYPYVTNLIDKNGSITFTNGG